MPLASKTGRMKRRNRQIHNLPRDLRPSSSCRQNQQVENQQGYRTDFTINQLNLVVGELHPMVDVKGGFRKGRGTRDQTANICWFIEKARELQKNTYLCFIKFAKAFDCVDYSKLWKTYRDWNTRPSFLSSEISVCRSGSNSKN